MSTFLKRQKHWSKRQFLRLKLQKASYSTLKTVQSSKNSGEWQIWLDFLPLLFSGNAWNKTFFLPGTLLLCLYHVLYFALDKGLPLCFTQVAAVCCAAVLTLTRSLHFFKSVSTNGTFFRFVRTISNQKCLLDAQVFREWAKAHSWLDFPFFLHE